MAKKDNENIQLEDENVPLDNKKDTNSNKKSKKKKKSLFKKIIITIFILGFLSTISVAGLIYYYSLEVFGEEELKDFNPPTAIRIYDRNDKLIALFYNRADAKKTVVMYSSIPKKIIDTIIAVEDKSFFKHSGIDYKGILRALITDVTTMSARQGASTITQQVAKNLLLTNEKKLSRKIKEAILAKRMEKILSKEEIISLYLNNIYLGGGNYGIVEAARYYFNKSLDELNTPEIAYLMGLPKNPNGYNLRRFPKRANQRKDIVLKRMLKNGVIKKSEFDKFYNKDLKYIGGSDINFHPASYLTTHILKILKKKYGKEFIYHNSLTIKTTIDIDLQKQAVQSLKKGLENLNRKEGILRPLRKIKNDSKKIKLKSLDEVCENCEEIAVKEIKTNWAIVETKDGEAIVLKKDLNWIKKFKPFLNYFPRIKKMSKILKKDYVYMAISKKTNYKIKDKTYPVYKIIAIPQVQGAIVSIDVETREVKALVGGYDFKFSEFNRATQSVRQAGSVFKPFVYAAAVKFLKDRTDTPEDGVNDYTPSRIVYDTPEAIVNRKTGAVWKPMNFTKMKFRNEITMKKALSKSINMVSVKLFSNYIDRVSRISEDKYDIDKGFEAFFKWVSSFGLTTKYMKSSYQLSLGATEVNLLEMVSAYTVFPSYGIYEKPKFIISIKDNKGKEYYEDKREIKRIMEEGEAYLMVDMMKEVVNHGTAVRARALGWPVGGKTGTTNRERNAWFIGYTKNIATGVWVGFDNRTPMGKFVQGGRTAAPIWLSYMKEALKDQKPIEFEPPKDIVFGFVDSKTGNLIPKGTEGAVRTPFIDGRFPEKLKDDRYVDPNGYLLEDEE